MTFIMLEGVIEIQSFCETTVQNEELWIELKTGGQIRR